MKRLIAVLLTAAAAHASAQTMKAGQWELQNKITSSNAQTDQAMAAALRQLASLPPEQRAQIEALMAKNGASMPKVSGDGSMQLSVCVTPEMAARQEIPTGQQGNCSSTNLVVPGGLNLSFRCTNPASSGTGTVRFIGDSGYTSSMTVTTHAHGKPEQMQVESKGRWLGACTSAPK
ncbi:MAG: DUF3617 domain-containing protein [Sphingomonadaceae bacterium]